MSSASTEAQRLATVQRHARPLDAPGSLDALFALLSTRRFALLGEASHGTHEFYLQRADITRTLIESHQCRAVVVEGDWPDAYRVNRWVRCLDDDDGAIDPLDGFARFPTWMWRNTVVRDFVHWLREFNGAQAPWLRVGFYGMDLYSLHASVQAVLAYLEQADPEAARRARLRYACFDHFEQDLQAYGYAAGFGIGSSCEDGVVAQLQDLLHARTPPVQSGSDADALFHAQQNARLVQNAEQYYRSMFNGRSSSWNLRDLHMVDTLMALSVHLQERCGQAPRIAVWAHNSHVGDASATAMGTQGEWNVGDLMRRRCPGETALVGFTTYAGTVRAACAWDAPGQVMTVRPGLPGSWETLLHEAGCPRFLLLPDDDASLREALSQPMLERAIGVIYRPESERRSHYFTARLADQFDAVIHIDQTSALQPLDGPTGPAPAAPAEATADTYPSGL
jgi:erythromycin esterase-like protein